MKRASLIERAETQPSVRCITWYEPARHGYKVSESLVFVYDMAKLRKFSTTFAKWYIQQHLRLKFPKQIRNFGLSPKIRRCYKKEWTNNLIMPVTVSLSQSFCAIITKIFSPLCWDPGWLLPRSRQSGLKIFHVIASQIFTDFVRMAGISLEKLTLLNRASPSHVIRA